MDDPENVTADCLTPVGFARRQGRLVTGQAKAIYRERSDKDPFRMSVAGTTCTDFSMIGVSDLGLLGLGSSSMVRALLRQAMAVTCQASITVVQFEASVKSSLATAHCHLQRGYANGAMRWKSFRCKGCSRYTFHASCCALLILTLCLGILFIGIPTSQASCLPRTWSCTSVRRCSPRNSCRRLCHSTSGIGFRTIQMQPAARRSRWISTQLFLAGQRQGRGPIRFRPEQMLWIWTYDCLVL